MSPALDALLQLTVMLQSGGGGGVIGGGVFVDCSGLWGSEQFVAACASNGPLVRALASALECALGELSSCPTLAPAPRLPAAGETLALEQPPRLNELFLRAIRTLEKLAVVIQRVSTFKYAIICRLIG